MPPTRPRRSARRRGRALAAGIAGVLAIGGIAALSGFHLPLSAVDAPGSGASGEVPVGEVVGIRTFEPPAGIRVEADVEFGAQPDGTLLTLDLCRPAIDAAEPRAAVVAIHGGSWTRGAKGNADWRRVCEWLASEGFVAASVDYRLVPNATFPAQLDDVSLAVEWLRGEAAALDIDPARIGVFGGSAGGQLAALLGTTGEGPTDAGSRVAAVVELSGPVGLAVEELDADGASGWLRSIVDAYLGCEEPAGDCGGLREAASPGAQADASDPPFFIGHAEDEIVPLGQSRRLAAQLAAAGLDVELAVVPGGEHSIGILDAPMRARVAAFLHERLAPAA